VLRHRLEHSCCTSFLSIICHFAYLVTWSCVQLVTTLSAIIPYYRLNHSIWSLSDNKESSR
jgi:hypothetical protein